MKNPPSLSSRAETTGKDWSDDVSEANEHPIIERLSFELRPHQGSANQAAHIAVRAGGPAILLRDRMAKRRATRLIGELMSRLKT